MTAEHTQVRAHTRTKPKAKAKKKTVSSAAHALELFDIHREDLVRQLQQAAVDAYQTMQRPVSTNDVRHVLLNASYSGDPRIMASAFPRKKWQPHGFVVTNSPNSHTHLIRTFVPREEAAS